MISLKKTLEGLDHRAMFNSAADSYRAVLESLAKNAIAIESEGLRDYRETLETLKNQVVPGKINGESLKDSVTALDAALGTYRREVETLITGTGSDLKEVVAVLAEATESLSQRENLHGGQLSRLSGSLEELAQSPDLQSIRGRLSEHILELRTCIDQMARDNGSALQTLQQELAGFQKKLEKVQIEASTDPLTGLANRRRAGREIGTRIREKRTFGVLLFDLNKFKQINDTHGHGAGDRVLQIVAQRLTKQIRKDDMVCRWGGDEFVIIRDGTGNELVSRGKEIAQQIGGPISVALNGETIKVNLGAEFGWAEYSAGDAVDQLLARADRTLSEAKTPASTLAGLPGAAPTLVFPSATTPAIVPHRSAPVTYDSLTGLADAEALKEAIARLGEGPVSYAVCFAVSRADVVDAHYGYAASEQILPHLAAEVQSSKFGGRLYRGKGPYLVALIQEPENSAAVDRELNRIKTVKLESHLKHKRRASIRPISVDAALIPIDPSSSTAGIIEEIDRFARLGILNEKFRGKRLYG